MILHFSTIERGFECLKAFLHWNGNKQKTYQKFKCSCNFFALWKAKCVIHKAHISIEQLIIHRAKCHQEKKKKGRKIQHRITGGIRLRLSRTTGEDYLRWCHSCQNLDGTKKTAAEWCGERERKNVQAEETFSTKTHRWEHLFQHDFSAVFKIFFFVWNQYYWAHGSRRHNP